MYPELVINVVGLISGFLITRKQPILRDAARVAANKDNPDGTVSKMSIKPSPGITISVIISLSSNQDCLNALIEDLVEQSRPAEEIILAGHISPEFGTNLIGPDCFRFVKTPSNSEELCNEQHMDYLAGAVAAAGDLLLFLSADVRLERDAIRLMLQDATKYPSDDRSCHFLAMSIQPYCEIMGIFENVSLFTMLTGSVGNGIDLKKTSYLVDPLNPVTLIPRDVFLTNTGRETPEKDAVKAHDPNLQLTKAKDKESLSDFFYLGGQDILFRSGAGRFRQMLHILVAGTAPRILRTPPRYFALIILWLVACTSIVIELVQASMQTDAWPVLVYLALYLLTLLQLNLASRHVGRFSKSAIFFYPLWLAAFWLIFTISLVRNFIFNKSKINHKETTL